MWLERRFAISFPCVSTSPVTRMELHAESPDKPAKVMLVTESVWCCCAQFFRATDQFVVRPLGCEWSVDVVRAYSSP